MNDTHVVAICGSLRDASFTRIALDHALSVAADLGASTDHVDLRDLDLPVFDPDDRDAGDADELRERVTAADSVILGSPVYHGSYTGALKNALDYCGFDHFEHTTVGLLAVGGGAFPVTTLEHLRSVCRALNAWVIPHQAAIPSARSQFDGDAFLDEKIEERVGTLGRRLVEYAHIEPDPNTVESIENVGGDD
ncbi:NADPH-dependent FMN reductase [Halomarina ordinaria]|uniref:NADPH-dependent FMN reductase n=1 Tax=Halomarina ordinaria TaxID=3033939 RepID=A0ABD5U4H0_9EURY|nr:NAD(P)H-dependent oxidoreductase [Halomarina sp. PSRA2]